MCDVHERGASERAARCRCGRRRRSETAFGANDAIPAVLEPELDGSPEALRVLAAHERRSLAVGRRDERALEVRDDRGRSLVRPALQGHHHSLDVVLRHGRPSRRSAHLRPQRREPRSAGGGRGELLVLALQRGRLRVGDLRGRLRAMVCAVAWSIEATSFPSVTTISGSRLVAPAAVASSVSGPGGDPGGEHERAERERGDERRAGRGGAWPPARERGGESRAQRRDPHRPRELDEPSRRADERERREDRDLRRELGRLRRDQERREQSHSDRVRAPSRGARGRRLRVGDHEEEEDEDLGRGDEQPPELPALDRPDVPGGRHRVAARGEHADPGGERQPEPDGDLQQVQPPQDEEASDDDQRQRERRARARADPTRARAGRRAARRAGGSRGRGRSSTG